MVDRSVGPNVQKIANMVVTLSRDVDAVGQEVSAVGVAQQQTRSELAELRADFLAYTRAAEQRANVQRAETKIGVLQDQLEHEFGHHKVVRRTAIGLLQAFDVGLVSEEAVRSVSEQLMIQTPRYWLAPALVALSAWSADERDLCDRAVAEAYRRSPSKTALLFTLVLRRQDRLDSSSRWLKHYLRAQDPTALGRDFAIILESVAHGAFGPAGRAIVDESLAAWLEALSDDASHDKQIARWRIEIENSRPAHATTDFPALAAVSPQWHGLGESLRGAEGHAPLLEKYRALMAEEITAPDRIEDALDDILDRLVQEFDNEELPLQRELAYNHAMVERNGDPAAAKADADAKTAAFEKTLDYLTIQTTSALDPGHIGVSRATQRIAVAACRPWFARAHEQVTSSYRQQLPGDVEVAFAGSHNVGGKTFQLPDWKGSLSSGLPQLEQSLGAHWDAHTDRYVRTLEFNIQQKAIVPGLVTLGVLIIGFLMSPIAGILLPLIVGGIWAIALHQKYQGSLKAQDDARKELGRWKQESLTQLRAAGAELTDWGSRFQQADARADEARAFITALDEAGHSATPFERRTISTAGGMA
jgi:hypothetical protein